MRRVLKSESGGGWSGERWNPSFSRSGGDEYRRCGLVPVETGAGGRVSLIRDWMDEVGCVSVEVKC